MERPEQNIRIIGILVPESWDAEGNVTRSAIMTANEGEYIVEENTKGKELLGLMRQKVEVKGAVRQEAGQNIITVKEYRQAE